MVGIVGVSGVLVVPPGTVGVRGTVVSGWLVEVPGIVGGGVFSGWLVDVPGIVGGTVVSGSFVEVPGVVGGVTVVSG
ncbi:MAG: hypothetical protein FJY98_00615 [Candidatus Liptonbacteria bacterium]|nr:hypothetical protein [Candidatus Liptonbacteria bacterium]